MLFAPKLNPLPVLAPWPPNKPGPDVPALPKGAVPAVELAAPPNMFEVELFDPALVLFDAAPNGVPVEGVPPKSPVVLGALEAGVALPNSPPEDGVLPPVAEPKSDGALVPLFEGAELPAKPKPQLGVDAMPS